MTKSHEPLIATSPLALDAFKGGTRREVTASDVDRLMNGPGGFRIHPAKGHYSGPTQGAQNTSTRAGDILRVRIALNQDIAALAAKI
jgi:hypothetical protein